MQQPTRPLRRDADNPADGRDEAKRPIEQDLDRQRWRKRLFVGLGVVVALAAIGYGIYYLLHGRFVESTNDAYLQADNVTISPKIAGYVVEVAVTDNQHVKAGEMLVRIDDRDYRIAVAQAEADAMSADADIANIDAQIALQKSNIVAAQADLDANQAQALYAAQNNQRYASLAKAGASSVQNAQQASAGSKSAEASVAKAKAQLDVAQKQLDVLTSQHQKAIAVLGHDRALLDQARLNLAYTLIAAPVEGTVGDRSVRIGQYVQPGAQLLTAVPLQATYLIANFKETQVRRMARGEHVDISIDAFPGATISGTVDSIAPGTGAQFALLPPENATGNFTKIVQRVPVKILIDPNDPLHDRIRPGLSVEATIDTRTVPKDSAGQPIYQTQR